MTAFPSAAQTLLDKHSVVAWLREMHIEIGRAPMVREMSGGVSNVVLLVSGDRDQVVVKQSLERLRVAQEWLASRARILVEADALRFFASITPDRVPHVLAIDEKSMAMAISAAPGLVIDWRQQLAAEAVDPRVGYGVGETLALWHGHSRTAELPDSLRGNTHLAALRIDPYFGAAAHEAPELATELRAVSDRLVTASECIVHGDFSPKNILIGPNLLWVIDAEVAHRGHPEFDRAFLAHHLIIDAVMRPAERESIHEAWTQFLRGYDHASDSVTGNHEDLSWFTGALLIARVHGMSRQQNLTARQSRVVAEIGRELLTRSAADLDAPWARILDGA